MTLPMTIKRTIPFTALIRMMVGGEISQIGWVIVGFGLIFVWTFMLHSEAVTFWKFIGPLRTAPGIVTSSYDTGATEGGNNGERGTPIYTVEYTFTTSDGQTYKGISFDSGGSFPVGGSVIVQYNSFHPEYSRIEGMRASMFEWPVAFVLIFPLFGLGMIIAMLIVGKNRLTTLKRGIPTLATLTEIRVINEHIVDTWTKSYLLHFELD